MPFLPKKPYIMSTWTWATTTSIITTDDSYTHHSFARTNLYTKSHCKQQLIFFTIKGHCNLVTSWMEGSAFYQTKLHFEFGCNTRCFHMRSDCPIASIFTRIFGTKRKKGGARHFKVNQKLTTPSKLGLCVATCHNLYPHVNVGKSTPHFGQLEGISKTNKRLSFTHTQSIVGFKWCTFYWL